MAGGAADIEHARSDWDHVLGLEDERVRGVGVGLRSVTRRCHDETVATQPLEHFGMVSDVVEEVVSLKTELERGLQHIVGIPQAVDVRDFITVARRDIDLE